MRRIALQNEIQIIWSSELVSIILKSGWISPSTVQYFHILYGVQSTVVQSMMSHYGSRAPEDHRRKWNRDEYEQRADERARASRRDSDEDDEKPKKKVRKEPAKARDEKVDLESRVGKSVIITQTTPLNLAGGFYCDVCDCVIKDSINYLDHINGKKRERNLSKNYKFCRFSVNYYQMD